MDYEKAYKAMVQRARELHEGGNALTKLQMEIVCPELAESEDERIRKEILGFIQLCLSRTNFGSRSIALRKEDAEMFERWVAYLEKQKESLHISEICKENADSFTQVVWSEEDYHWEGLIRLLQNYQRMIDRKSNNMAYEDVECYISWLKSIRPQPHTVPIKDTIKFGNLEYERGVKDGIQSEKSHQWKPSEEQMRVLNWAAYGMVDNSIAAPEMHTVLRELCEQLKQIKED